MEQVKRKRGRPPGPKSARKLKSSEIGTVAIRSVRSTTRGDPDYQNLTLFQNCVNGGKEFLSEYGPSSLDLVSQETLHEVLECIIGYMRGRVKSLPKLVQGKFDEEYISMIRKMDNGIGYQSPDEFLEELNAMRSRYKREYLLDKTDNNNFRCFKMSSENLKHATGDLKCARICIDCVTSYYSGEDDFFTLLCRNPHMLVWAQVQGFAYWPAKIYKKTPSTGEVTVRFFGTHDMAALPLTACVPLTREYPWKNKLNSTGLKEAIEETMVHIDRLREYFGQSMVIFSDHLEEYRGNLYLRPVDAVSTVSDQQMACTETIARDEKRTASRDKLFFKVVPIETALRLSDADSNGNMTIRGKELAKYSQNQLYQPSVVLPSVPEELRKKMSQIIDDIIFQQETQTGSDSMDSSFQENTSDNLIAGSVSKTPKRRKKNKVENGNNDYIYSNIQDYAPIKEPEVKQPEMGPELLGLVKKVSQVDTEIVPKTVIIRQIVIEPASPSPKSAIVDNSEGFTLDFVIDESPQKDEDSEELMNMVLSNQDNCEINLPEYSMELSKKDNEKEKSIEIDFKEALTSTRLKNGVKLSNIDGAADEIESDITESVPTIQTTFETELENNPVTPTQITCEIDSAEKFLNLPKKDDEKVESNINKLKLTVESTLVTNGNDLKENDDSILESKNFETEKSVELVKLKEAITSTQVTNGINLSEKSKILPTKLTNGTDLTEKSVNLINQATNGTDLKENSEKLPSQISIKSNDSESKSKISSAKLAPTSVVIKTTTPTTLIIPTTTPTTPILPDVKLPKSLSVSIPLTTLSPRTYVFEKQAPVVKVNKIEHVTSSSTGSFIKVVYTKPSAMLTNFLSSSQKTTVLSSSPLTTTATSNQIIKVTHVMPSYTACNPLLLHHSMSPSPSRMAMPRLNLSPAQLAEKRQLLKTLANLKAEQRELHSQHDRELSALHEKGTKEVKALSAKFDAELAGLRKSISEGSHPQVVALDIEYQQRVKSLKLELQKRTYCAHCLIKEARQEPSCPCNFANYCSALCRKEDYMSHRKACAVYLKSRTVEPTSGGSGSTYKTNSSTGR